MLGIGIVVVAGAAAWLDIHSLIHGKQEWNDRGRDRKGGRDNQYERDERDIVDCAKGNNYSDLSTELVKLCFTAPRQCVLYRAFFPLCRKVWKMKFGKFHRPLG